MANGQPALQNPPQVPQQRQSVMRPQFIEDFTAYEIDFAAVAPGATANGAIQIQADSAFKWVKAAYQADIAAAAFTMTSQPVPNVTVQITDGGSGRQLFSNPVPVPSVFGTGQLPFILPVMRIFKQMSSINFSVANYDAVVTYNLRLTLLGTKIFNYQESAIVG